MSDVVNLRKARKARQRAAARGEGDANAARFGRSKPQRAAEDRDRAQAERRLDGHKRDDSGDP